MSTREALLNAIIENPDDDAVRLVYADFLQETGDRVDAARAELIRAEIARCQLPPGDPEKSGLLQQALALVKKHRLEWFPFVKSSDSLPLRLDRGFASKWFFQVPTLFAEGPELFAREPITEITLSAKQRGELRTAAVPIGLLIHG